MHAIRPLLDFQHRGIKIHPSNALLSISPIYIRDSSSTAAVGEGARRAGLSYRQLVVTVAWRACPRLLASHRISLPNHPCTSLPANQTR